MAEPVEIRDPLERRLDELAAQLATNTRTLEDLETTLVVLVERFNQFAALYRTDHHGVGRGGIREEDEHA